MFKTEQRGQTSLYNISYHPQHVHRFSVFIVLTESSGWHCSGFYLPALVCCCLLYISLHLRICLLHGDGWHHHHHHQRLQHRRHYESSPFLLHLFFLIFFIIQVGGVWCTLVGIGLEFPWAFGYMSLPLVGFFPWWRWRWHMGFVTFFSDINVWFAQPTVQYQIWLYV